MKKIIRFLRLLLIIFFLPAGGLLFGLFVLPYSRLKSLGDSFSKDGNLELLSTSFYNNAHIPLILLGLGFLLLAGVLIFRAQQSLEVIEWVVKGVLAFWNRSKKDWIILWTDFVAALPRGPELWLLLGIVLAAFLIRWVLIVRPMGHDESYTFITFADLPFRYLVSDYHFPNNHVFHTILVRLCYLILGIQPWSIRLPAFLAGVLLVLMAYFPARQLYGRGAGLLTAALTASGQFLIDYSTYARGYSLVVLFSLLIFSLGIYTSRKKNLAAWEFIILFSALGFYTVPNMIIGMGSLYAWMGLSWLVGDIDPAYKRWGMIKYILLSGIISILIGLTCYSPIFFHQGPQIFFSNAYVEPVSWQNFPLMIQTQLNLTWSDFTQDIPSSAAAVIATLGVLFSLVFHFKISHRRVPFLVAVVLFLVVDVLVQRTQPASRSWVMLQPVFYMVISAGLLAPFQWLDDHRPQPVKIQASKIVLGGVLVLLLAGNGVRSLDIYNRTAGPQGMGDVERTVLYLKEQLSGTDIVVAAPPDDAPYWYYFRLHEIPGYYIYGVKIRSFDRAFIPINRADDDTRSQTNVEKALVERGPDLVFMDLKTDQIIQTIGKIEIHLVYPNKERLKSQYGE